MLKSILIYAGILIAVFALRFGIIALVDKLESMLRRREKPSPPFFIPFVLALLTFFSGVLTVAQIAVPILWIVSRWNAASAILLTLAILIAVVVGTRMAFAALQDMTQYNTIKSLHVITAVVFILYMDWPLNLACETITMGFSLPDIVRMISNIVLFFLYLIFVIVLLIRSFKSFSY